MTLEEMKKVRPEEVDRSKLVQIGDVKVDPKKKEERIAENIRQIKNPYSYLDGKTIAYISFSETDRTIEDCIRIAGSESEIGPVHTSITWCCVGAGLCFCLEMPDRMWYCIDNTRRIVMKNKGEYRDAFEEIYNNLKLELLNVDQLVRERNAKKEFSDFELRRLYGSLENAVEVYGEVLGYITYE